ncbi:MspA protein [Nocardia tenerifensis]|uniref:MspA protein n=1 Tax=Nocardia tenerifensis TaxID=228006 RepID=A0A318JXA1_9NOCA|nr:MspA family porin [Nocardia tenerifensis]PXX58371.1 MspA protein [Nocardia tenerifensis]
MREKSQQCGRSVRLFAVATIVASGLAFGMGAAGAVVDSSSQIVDQKDRSIEAVQSDTRIDFVPPLDGNPFTREWFHNGEASFKVTGPNADDWRGHITIGYQVGYPATLSGRLKFGYSTPGLGADLGGDSGVLLKLDGLIPRAGIELEVGLGPGIQTVECAGGDISGTSGFIRMSGFHGTVTGVVGQTTIRPFVKVASGSGDTVYTYGRLWAI